jgi:hypothetical protein
MSWKKMGTSSFEDLAEKLAGDLASTLALHPRIHILGNYIVRFSQAGRVNTDLDVHFSHFQVQPSSDV